MLSDTPLRFSSILRFVAVGCSSLESASVSGAWAVAVGHRRGKHSHVDLRRHIVIIWSMSSILKRRCAECDLPAIFIASRVVSSRQAPCVLLNTGVLSTDMCLEMVTPITSHARFFGDEEKVGACKNLPHPASTRHRTHQQPCWSKSHLRLKPLVAEWD